MKTIFYKEVDRVEEVDDVGGDDGGGAACRFARPGAG